MSTETSTAPGADQAKDVQPKRMIILYATRGSKKEKVETDVTTWAELKKIASQKGFEVNKLHCTENATKTDLVHDEAVLPSGPFTLFMRPKETKSGAMDRKELLTAISNFIGKDNEKKKLFTVDGKNRTQLSTETLEELYNEHIAKGGKSKPSKAETKPAAGKSNTKKKDEPKKDNKSQSRNTGNAADIVSSVQASKAGNSLMDAYNLAVQNLTFISENAASEDVKGLVKNLLTQELPILKQAIEDEANPDKAAAKADADRRKREEEEENRRLAEEAKKFS